MKRNYKLNYKLVVCILLLSLCLQSCGKFSSLPTSSGKEKTKLSKEEKERLFFLTTQSNALLHDVLVKQSTSDEGHVVSLSQTESQAQASIPESLFTDFSKEQEKSIEVELPTSSQLNHVYRGNRGLERRMKRKIKDLEKEEKEKQTEGKTKGQANRNRPPKHQRLLTKQKSSKDEKKIILSDDISILPPELVYLILGHIPFPYILDCRRVNRFFYELITGYSQVEIGVSNKPNSLSYPANWIKDKPIDFKRDKLASLPTEKISSFCFYRLMGEVINLPLDFWSSIQGSQIHTLDLSNNKIDDKGIIELAEALPNTQIHTLDLSNNRMSVGGASKLAETLPHTKIVILNLRGNHTGNKGVSKLVRALVNTHIDTLDLTYNHSLVEEAQIGFRGAIKLAKAFRNTTIRNLNLSNNAMSTKGASKLAEILPTTQICTLNLSYNRIKDKGVSKLVKTLPDTEIHTLNLSDDQITSKGAIKLIEALPHTKVHTLALDWNNEIKEEALVKLAEILPATKIHTLSLVMHNIHPNIRQLLCHKNPNIKFSF